MGIRVRKLARELQQSPRDVLQLLQSLGFERYQSPEDMISDTVAARVRSSSRPAANGHHAPDPARSRLRASPGAPTPPGDIMAQLVPGVKRARTDQRSQANGRAEAELEQRRAELAKVGAAQQAEREALDATRRDLDARAAHLDAEALRLAALAESVAARQAELDVRAEALETARIELVAEQLKNPPATRANVVELLRERGVRGVDEAQRAIGALAFGHVLGPLVKDLAVVDETAFRQVLAEKLVLVGGEVPEGLSVPGVSVSPDRADLPGADVLARAVGRLAEQWLLYGFRTVTLAGVPPRWHGLLRSLVDKRVSLHFVPPPSAAPAEPPGASEAWFAWGPPPTDATVERAFWIPADGNLMMWVHRAVTVLSRAP